MSSIAPFLREHIEMGLSGSSLYSMKRLCFRTYSKCPKVCTKMIIFRFLRLR